MSSSVDTKAVDYETRFLVAKNAWSAEQLMKRIYQGKVQEYNKLLLRKEGHAVARIRQKPFGVQEFFSVFKVNFNEKRITKIRS